MKNELKVISPEGWEARRKEYKICIYRRKGFLAVISGG